MPGCALCIYRFVCCSKVDHLAMPIRHDLCYDWVSSEEGKTSETGRSAELAFVQRDWS